MLNAEKRIKNSVLETKQDENNFILKTALGKVRITPFASHILRITFTEKDEFAESSLECVEAVSANPPFSVRENEQGWSVETDRLVLDICRESCAFSYRDRNGKLLTREPEGGGKYLMPYDAYKTVLDENTQVERIQTPDGIREVIREPKKVFDKKLYHTRLEFEWQDEEALYGLGQSENGFFNLRGTRQYIHQANMKIAIPFFLSTQGYGILMDTGSPLIFNDNAYGSYLYNESAEELSYYFIAGDCFDEIISGYRTLTGKAVMLPLWAFGFMQSQERYKDQKEILDTAAKYRALGIPLDSIVLDWQSWKDGEWGQKSFDPERFPNPKEMVEKLHEQNVHFMISIWPNMDKITENYAQMKEAGCLLPQSETYDAFQKEARELYWKQMEEGLFSQGVDAWWCDASEPFSPEWASRLRPEPDKNYQEYCKAAAAYLEETKTNAYPYFHAKTVYEGQRSVTEAKRVANLTRSAYTGQQKFGTILWSGDTCAKWKTLREQIAAGLSFCASGLPYWTLDIGAFFTKRGMQWFWDGDYDDGCEDLGYRELYTRWFQYAAFLPVFRAHGTDTRREIWNYGKPGEMFYDALKKAVELRYQLIPYIYSLAAETYFHDYTMLRLLAFDFGEDAKVYDIKDQFMFGPALMVCPVTEPMYYGAGSKKLEGIVRERKVYLPKGCDWYDFRTNRRYAGGQEITVDAKIDSIPVFVKGGIGDSDGADITVYGADCTGSDDSSRLWRCRWKFHTVSGCRRRLRV